LMSETPATDNNVGTASDAAADVAAAARAESRGGRRRDMSIEERYNELDRWLSAGLGGVVGQPTATTTRSTKVRRKPRPQSAVSSRRMSAGVASIYQAPAAARSRKTKTKGKRRPQTAKLMTRAVGL